jgi:ABC-type polysaccharide/polyol phosphate export permease
MQPGLADILRTIRMPRLVLYMAWSDIRARYKRSVLGPFWITLSTAISVVAFSFIWSELLHVSRAVFVPMLTVGLVLWQFMSGCVTESTSVFVRQAGIIRNLDLPLSIHPAQLVLRQLINLAHNLPLFFIVAVIMGVSFDLHTLMAAPGLLLVTANLLWMSLLIGMLGARFRDLEYLIGMIMPLLMFLSPVMYRPNALPVGGKYMWINPFADMIEIIRYPLLGEATPGFLYAVNLGMLVAGGGLTLFLFNAKRKRIAFWV